MSVLLKIVIIICLICVSGQFVIYTKQKIADMKYLHDERIIDMVVEATEQKYGEGMSVVKMEYAKDILKNDYDISCGDLRIEATVIRLHANGYDYFNAHMKPYDMEELIEEDDEDEDDDEGAKG